MFIFLICTKIIKKYIYEILIQLLIHVDLKKKQLVTILQIKNLIDCLLVKFRNQVEIILVR